MTDNLERMMYRPAEAFEAAGISRSVGYSLIASGEWPSVRIGRAIRIPVEELRLWIQSKTSGNHSREDSQPSSYTKNKTRAEANFVE